MENNNKRVLVTVGTTKFEKLIQAASSREVLDELHRLGYDSVQYQTGSGKYTKIDYMGLKLQYDSYFENFAEEIAKSDLVLSHGGAGTCLEVLKNRKPLIVILNEDLMDNHQIELATRLQLDGYLQYCTCDKLLYTLSTTDFNQLKPYPQPDTTAFSKYLNKCMGFVD